MRSHVYDHSGGQERKKTLKTIPSKTWALLRSINELLWHIVMCHTAKGPVITSHPHWDRIRSDDCPVWDSEVEAVDCEYGRIIKAFFKTGTGYSPPPPVGPGWVVVLVTHQKASTATTVRMPVWKALWWQQCLYFSPKYFWNEGGDNIRQIRSKGWSQNASEAGRHVTQTHFYWCKRGPFPWRGWNSVDFVHFPAEWNKQKNCLQ